MNPVGPVARAAPDRAVQARTERSVDESTSSSAQRAVLGRISALL
jgi:hypothetical protein